MDGESSVVVVTVSMDGSGWQCCYSTTTAILVMILIKRMHVNIRTLWLMLLLLWGISLLCDITYAMSC